MATEVQPPVVELPVPSNNRTKESKFNNLNHDCEIYLDNGIENNRFYINPSAIVNLTIHTSLADWVTRGSITVMYSPETTIPKSTTGNDVEVSGNRTLKLPPNYIFRNDGYDILSVKIIPSESRDVNLIGDNSAALPIDDKKFWYLSHLFSIYDKEDIDMPPGVTNAMGSTSKAYKLYFWDAIYQKLNTTYIEYSTALSPEANIEADIAEVKYSNYGLIPTGRAIKEIIDIGVSEDGQQSNYTGRGANTSSWLGGKPATAEVGEEWEDGSAKIFYTAPAFANAYESMLYVYEKHISSQGISSTTDSGESILGDFSLLYKEKGPDEGDYGYLTLKPISKYFEKAGKGETAPGEYQIEHFFLQSIDNYETSKTLRAPFSINLGDTTVDIKTVKYHTITNFRFTDISGLTNAAKFNNQPVYSFNFRDREFNVEFSNNKVTAARDFMNRKYISNLYKGTSDDSSSFLITLNQDKERCYVPSFSLDGDNPEIRQHTGLQQLLKIGVFQNLAVNFRTLGLSYRVPGRFIGIDKLEGVYPGEFEDKFFGQWFIIDIKHVFEGELYFNDITAIKLHRFDSLPLTLPQTI